MDEADPVGGAEILQVRRQQLNFLSRFCWSLQVFDISHENSVFVIAKEKVSSVATAAHENVRFQGCRARPVHSGRTVATLR
jgi:hypothetical protein